MTTVTDGSLQWQVIENIAPGGALQTTLIHLSATAWQPVYVIWCASSNTYTVAAQQRAPIAWSS